MTMLTLTRRTALALLGAAALPSISFGQAAGEPVITVHKDPSCGCCSGWVRHLQASGFSTTVVETTDVGSLKTRLAVPDDLTSCHTAEMAGYVIEGHVPANAIRRLLAEKPTATGLAVPGMPAGAPGMGPSNQAYDVILFGPNNRSTYMRFVGDRVS